MCSLSIIYIHKHLHLIPSHLSLSMGKKRVVTKSHTLPSSPTHSLSSSSSEFEFRISLSPRKSSATADELFYKGQLLPLSLSPRLSLVRSLLASASLSSSSSARDSSGSSADSHSSFTADCDSSRPSSAAAGDDDDELLLAGAAAEKAPPQQLKKKFSLSRFSAVFRKDPAAKPPPRGGDVAELSSVKRLSSTAKEVIFKYFKKVKPLYEKISNKQQQKMSTTTIRAMSSTDLSLPLKTDIDSSKETNISIESSKNNNESSLSHSFSGNLKYPRKRNYGSSCPSSMRSSPSHSGVLYGKKFPSSNNGTSTCYTDTSSMDELQSAIQGAIAHCKNSMVQDKGIVSNEI